MSSLMICIFEGKEEPSADIRKHVNTARIIQREKWRSETPPFNN